MIWQALQWADATAQPLTAADTDLMSLPMRVRVSSTMGTAGALPPTSRSHDVYSRSPVAGQDGVSRDGMRAYGDLSAAPAMPFHMPPRRIASDQTTCVATRAIHS